MRSSFPVLLLTLLFCSGFLESFREKRHPMRYLIPDGYVGWVQVTWGVKGEAEFPVEEGFYLVQFGPDGRVKYSTQFETGWATDEYFYVSPDGKRRQIRNTPWGGGGKIWAGSHSNEDADGRVRERFFVGSEAELEVHKDRKP